MFCSREHHFYLLKKASLLNKLLCGLYLLKKGGINTKVPLINQKTEILQSTQNRKPLDSLLNQGASLKTAATYSPTVTQYHRRDEA